MAQGKVREIDVIGHLKHLGSKGLGDSIQMQIVVWAVHNQQILTHSGKSDLPPAFPML